MAANAPQIFGPTEALTEIKTSPRYEFGSTVTKTRIYEGVFALCVSGGLYEGAIGTGDQLGYLVSKSTVEKLGNGFGRLTVVWKGVGVTPLEGEPEPETTPPLPPDEYSVSPYEINPSIERHPIFSTVTPTEFININSVLEAATPEKRKEALEAVS